MASTAKQCSWCLNMCYRRPFAMRRDSHLLWAQSSNGGRPQGPSTVELERPDTATDRKLDGTCVSDLPSTDSSDRSLSLGWPESELKQPAVFKAVAVEFMAQAMFNFASCSAVVSAANLAGGTAILMPWQVMAFHSALLFVLVGASQPISGGHFNPMVSTMMAFWGVLPWRRLPLYIAAQIAGAAIGSAMQFYSLPVQMQDSAHAGIQAVPPDHTVAQAFMGETAAAFILMFVVCMVGLDSKGDPKKIPAVMALTIPALIYIVGPVSSMCINPARAFGPALVSGFWEHHWLWWTAPFLGGLLAVAPYKYMTRQEEQQEKA